MKVLVALALLGVSAVLAYPAGDKFDVTKDKIGGKAGIRPRDREDEKIIGGAAGIRKERSAETFDVTKDKIGGAAGIRPKDDSKFDVTKDKIGGLAGIRPRDDKKFDVAKDKIGGQAGIRHKRAEPEKMIGGQAGIRKDNKEAPVVDVKPWKKSEPNLRELKKKHERPTRAAEFDTASDKIGGAAGIRPTEAAKDVKPWKKNEPRLGGRVN